MDVVTNARNNKYCCYCIHWYDPTYSCLKPTSSRDLFLVDNSKKSKCLLKNFATTSLMTCPNFERKRLG